MSEQNKFDILGFWGAYIYFSKEENSNKSIFKISTRLPKEELVLRLKIDPEDVKAMKDEILVQAGKRRLTFTEKEKLEKCQEWENF